MKASSSKRNVKAAVQPVPSTPPVPVLVPSAAADTQPVGTQIKVGETDLAVLRALNEAMMKMKVAAFDQCWVTLMQAGKAIEPLDEQFKKKGRAAALAAGVTVDADKEWKFVLEDGIFTRTK